jgi:hypothetical protein
MPSTTLDRTTLLREQRLRGKARRQGLSLRKSRVRNLHIDDQGGYMLLAHDWNGISSHDGVVLAGARFDLELDDVERFLADD